MELGPQIQSDGSPRPHSPSESFARFTNRESEQAILHRQLSAGPGKRLPILMFFGVAGQGKTWLLRRFRERFEPNLPVARIDFHERSTIGRIEWLKQIRLHLACPAPRFDLAYMASGAAAGSLSEKGALEKRAAREIGGTAAMDLVDLLTGFPFLNTAYKVFSAGRKRLFEDDDERVRREWMHSEVGRRFLESLARISHQPKSPDR